MKLRLTLIGLTLSGLGALSSANAADMYVPGAAGPGGYKDEPYLAPWAGWYAGANGGYGWNDSNNKLTYDEVVPPLGVFDHSPGFKSNGGFGGGQIGYNWQGIFHPHLVLGLEADIQGAGITGSSQGLFDVLKSDSFHAKSSLDWFGSVRGRLGFAFGSVLVYGTGGFAYGGVDNSVTASGGGETVVMTKNDIQTGYTAGGGVEYLLSPAWSVKVEYQYIDLGKESPSGTSNIGNVYKTPGIQDKFDTVRLGINYHFGSTYEPLK